MSFPDVLDDPFLNIISAGGYEAGIRNYGGGLSWLKFLGRDLVEPYDKTATIERFRGDVLAPWPNRIRDGLYSFDNHEFRLPINEKNRNNSLHGLVNGLNWQVAVKTISEVELAVTLASCDFYPSTLQMRVRYQLDEEGLLWSLTAKNVGREKVPYGASIHPYLIAQPNER